MNNTFPRNSKLVRCESPVAVRCELHAWSLEDFIALLDYAQSQPMIEWIFFAIAFTVVVIPALMKRWAAFQLRRRIIRDLPAVDFHALYTDDPHYFAKPKQVPEKNCPLDSPVGFANQWRGKWHER